MGDQSSTAGGFSAEIYPRPEESSVLSSHEESHRPSSRGSQTIRSEQAENLLVSSINITKTDAPRYPGHSAQTGLLQQHQVSWLSVGLSVHLTQEHLLQLQLDDLPQEPDLSSHQNLHQPETPRGQVSDWTGLVCPH